MKQEILVKFGERVRDERLKNGFYQEEIAAKAGLHRTYIGMIERGEKNITLGNMSKISKALKVKLSDLLEGL